MIARSRLKPIPFPLGPVHFVGIGGIGMSAIAEIMLRDRLCGAGLRRQGLANTERLEKLGAKIFIGHAAEHVDGASAVVYSTARSRPTIRSCWRRASGASRWCAAPRCWPS